jgi:hypothetical protein
LQAVSVTGSSPLTGHGVGEGHEDADVEAVVADVRPQGLPEAHRVRAGAADDHRLGLTGDLARDPVAEVLDDDLGLLRQVVLVQRDEPGDGRPCLGRLIARVVGDGLLQPEEGLVRRVAGQHVVARPGTSG